MKLTDEQISHGYRLARDNSGLFYITKDSSEKLLMFTAENTEEFIEKVANKIKQIEEYDNRTTNNPR